MGIDVVGNNHSAFFNTVFKGIEIVDVFVFCGVEKSEIKKAWFIGNCFRCVAENLGNVFGDLCFFKIFGGEMETFFFVRFNGI